MHQLFVKIHHLILSSIIFFSGTGHLIQAQEANNVRKIAFTCLVWETLVYPELYILDGDAFLPLEFSVGNRSKRYSLKKAREFALYAKKTDPTHKNDYELVGKTALVKESNQILLMILPASNSAELPLKLVALDDSTENFPRGSFKFVNFSGDSIQVKFSQQISSLPAGGIRIVKAAIPPKGGFMPFLMEDSAGNTVFETRLFAQPQGREIVFIAPPKEKNSLLRVLFVHQIIPDEEP